MNLFDLGAFLLAVVATIIGFRSGALPQIGGLGGAIVGGAIGLRGVPIVAGLLESFDPLPRAIAVLVVLLALVGIGEGIGSAAGRGAARQLGSGLFGLADRFGGALIGLAQAALVVWLVGGLLAVGPSGPVTRIVHESTAVRTLDRVLPPPTAVAVELGRLLDDSGLPDVFVGLDPVPGPPVDLPAEPEIRAAAAAAIAGTGRVSAEACGAISSGTGFAVAPGYVVTNAHVVAGSSAVRIAVGGTAYDATTVLFDPDLDVALLHVPRLDAPTLRFASSDPGRGATGAAVGFPDGGPMDVIPAAVSGRFEARGRDIYDDRQVIRPILELRAEIEPGDSGGPFVLLDGTVGGVVFAESRSNDDVGYALAATAVATRVGPGIGRSSEVATGDCVAP